MASPTFRAAAVIADDPTMLEVVGGAWKRGHAVVARTRRGDLRYVAFPKGFLQSENVGSEDIASVDLVTQENQKSIAAKAGWGLAGGVLLGGVGALAGLLAGGEGSRLTVMLTHRDGRKVLLRGQSDEVHVLLGAMVGGSEPDGQGAAFGGEPSRNGPLRWIVALAFIGIGVMAIPRLASFLDPMNEVLHEREALEQLSAAGLNRTRALITDEMILEAIRKSDGFPYNQGALLRASRAFLRAGGNLGDLREMGGWVRSTRHGGRVMFTYRRPGMSVSDCYYYDLDTGRLFQ